MKKRDLTVVLIVPLLVFISVFLFDVQINYFTSLLLVFGIPSLYLSLKNMDKIKKIGLFSLLASIPVAIIFELIGFGDQAWTIPNSIFPYRLFGFSPLENYIWMFICTYIIILFYEHFCNNRFQPGFSKRINVMVVILSTLTFITVAIFMSKPSLLTIPYTYLWLCLLFWLIPISLFLIRYPKYTANFFYVSIFFFYIHMIFELIGVKLSHWLYEGTNYAGWISFFGLSFPVEEFFFVILWGGFAPLVYYEFFANKPSYKTIKR